MNLTKEKIVELLSLEDFSPIYELADKVRKETVGEVVHIRGIIEFSNYCRRSCTYCGLNCNNTLVERYRMTPDEIIHLAREAGLAGYKTIVLQSGEDPFFTASMLGSIIEEIKKEDLSVTISCGEFSFDELSYLRVKGADRYLLKHETGNANLYSKLHPCGTLEERVNCLKNIKKLGFETGSGFMIGLPGQTLEIIAEDLLLLKEIGCDMAGIGPFIAHPETPLAGQPSGSTEMTKRAVALARILMPEANLPVTTSLGVLSQEERNHAFLCGANVIMKKVTPDQYKKLYEIYPSNFNITNIKEDRKNLEKLMIELGRIPL